jgi:hypothetical protein
MKKELDEKLCRTYPALYRDRHGDKMRTLMCWGFDCEDGWYPLIDTVSILLTRHNSEIVAQQVKEKTGSLCFYHVPCSDYTNGVELMAEVVSETVCEICGAPGAVYYANHWLSTRCEAHAKPQHLAGEKEQFDAVPVFGLGLGWSRLVMLLQHQAKWDTEQNACPQASFQVTKVNGRLRIELTGGNAETQGMVDFIVHYAGLIDEQTGALNSPV